MQGMTICLIIAIISFVPNVNAATCLQAVERFGVAVSSDSASVNDPDGNTETGTAIYPSFIYALPINRNYPEWRLWNQISYRRFEINPSTSLIGQNVESFTVASVAQRSICLSRNVRPWLGFGFAADIASYTKRQTADRDGFLAKSFADRSATTLNMVFNVGLGSRRLNNLYIVGNYFLANPMGNGIRSSQFQFSILF